MIDDEMKARLSLLSLGGIGPARLQWLLRESSASEAVAALTAGRLPTTSCPAPAGVTRPMVQGWTEELRSCAVEELVAKNTAAGATVLDPTHPLWPFVDDPDPPALLFTRGELSVLTAGVMVAIVGTRRCTAVGRQVATELGSELAEAGVAVVSGLAIGIDGCAHRGALAAGGRPVGVVATGLDVVYPAANRRLWDRVGETGLLLSEAPAGTEPERWRFPARNRMIAALADVVVVVESHSTGGSMHTVHEAAERGRLVMAVPGSVTSPAAAGTNQLLSEGCPPVRGAADVIDALGLALKLPRANIESVCDGSVVASTEPQPRSSVTTDLAALVLDEVRAGPVHIDLLAARTDAELAEQGGRLGPSGPAVHHILAVVSDLVAEGKVVLDGSTVSLRQQPPL